MRVSVSLCEDQVIQGAPVILAVAFENTTDTPLRFANPAQTLRATVKGIGDTEDPPEGDGPLRTGWSFVVAPHSTMTYYQNLWAFHDLERAGTYQVTGGLAFAARPAAEPKGDSRTTAALTGQTEYGPLRFQVLEPSPEESNAYGLMAGKWAEVWWEQGEPPDVKLASLARHMAAEDPDSVYLPYVWWRAFHWYIPLNNQFQGLDSGEARRVCQAFRQRYPEFPMFDEVKWVEAWLGGLADPRTVVDLEAVAKALEALAAETSNVTVQMRASVYAQVIRTRYM